MTTSRLAANGLIAVWVAACSSGDTAGTDSLGGAGGSGGADSGVGDAGSGRGGQGNDRGGASGTGGASGAGGSSGSGDGGSGGCTAPAPSALVGWASVAGMGVTTTTGGGTTTPLRVTTLEQLNSAAAGTNAAVIWLQGVVSGNVTIGSNKTIVGVCDAEIRGHVEMSGSTNGIVRNITIVGYGVRDR